MSKRSQSAPVEADLQFTPSLEGPGSSENATKPVFSPQALARLWPNRVHESSWLKSLACYFGMHRWQDMQFGSSATSQAARFCRWCSKINPP